MLGNLLVDALTGTCELTPRGVAINDPPVCRALVEVSADPCQLHRGDAQRDANPPRREAKLAGADHDADDFLGHKHVATKSCARDAHEAAPSPAARNGSRPPVIGAETRTHDLRITVSLACVNAALRRSAAASSRVSSGRSAPGLSPSRQTSAGCRT